jgi:hypothetical protein
MAVQDRDLRLDSISFFACEKTAKKHQKQTNTNKSEAKRGQETHTGEQRLQR